MVSGLVAVIAFAAAAAADEAPPATPALQLDASRLSTEAAGEAPDIRSWKQRRRAAANRALGWMNAPLDDRELALAISHDVDPSTLGVTEEDGPIMADGAEVVWHRPSLLTLGQVPGQPDSAEWTRWQAAIDRARARRAATED
jgi:hypothetical protein